MQNAQSSANYFNSPHAVIVIFCDGEPPFEPHFSIFLTTSEPEITWPNTTCLPSNQSALKMRKQRKWKFSRKTQWCRWICAVGDVAGCCCCCFDFLSLDLLSGCYEKLRSICVRTRVGHRQRPKVSMFQDEIFVGKLFAIDRFTAGAIVVREIATLTHLAIVRTRKINKNHEWRKNRKATSQMPSIGS